jgi:hypothetical protein
MYGPWNDWRDRPIGTTGRKPPTYQDLTRPVFEIFRYSHTGISEGRSNGMKLQSYIKWNPRISLVSEPLAQE